MKGFLFCYFTEKVLPLLVILLINNQKLWTSSWIYLQTDDLISHKNEALTLPQKLGPY